MNLRVATCPACAAGCRRVARGDVARGSAGRSGKAGHTARQLSRRDGKRSHAHDRGPHQAALQGARGLAGEPRPFPLHAVGRRARSRAAGQDTLRVRAACRRDRGVPGRVADRGERHQLGGARPDGRDQDADAQRGRRARAKGKTRYAARANRARRWSCRSKRQEQAGPRRAARRRGSPSKTGRRQAASRRRARPSGPNAPLNLRKTNKPAKKVTGKSKGASS